MFLCTPGYSKCTLVGDGVPSLLVLLANRDALIDGNISKDLLCSARPLDLGPIDFIALAQTEVEVAAIIALVAPATVDFVNEGKITRNNFDLGANRIPIRATT